MSQSVELRRGKLAIILLLIVAFMTTHSTISYANEDSNQVVRSLEGTITDEIGDPVQGATVQIGTYAPYTGFQIVASTTTDAYGEYLVTYTKTLGDAVSAILNVNGYVVVFEVQGNTLDFQIPQQKSTITGKLTYGDQFETPVSHYPLSLKVYLGRGGWISITDVWTDSEGNYTMTIIPGEFNSARGVNYFSLFYNEDWESTVELYPGQHKVNDQVIYDVQPGTYLNGLLQVEVTDESNVPIEDAVVELVSTNVAFYQAGHYFFSDVIRGGAYTLNITAPGYTQAEESIIIDGGISYVSVKLVPNSQ